MTLRFLCASPEVPLRRYAPTIFDRLRWLPGLRAIVLVVVVALPLLVPGRVRATQAPRDSTVTGSDLTRLALEDLMSLQVTSVSRRQQRLSDIAGAVTVIEQDRIRASGATTLADVLRLVPGFQVAKIDANMWSISARGFSGRIANKLLLLIDGRTAYSPIFSGVYWDEQDLPLEDVERVEVIRGPGASMWGANAVNGVINVITKDAHKTRGASVTGFAGNEEMGGGLVQWSGALGERGALRTYLQGATRAPGGVAGRDAPWDSWQTIHGGFRADGSALARSQWTVSGELRGGNTGQALNAATTAAPFSLYLEPLTRSRGGNLLGNWRYTLSPRADLTTQAYVDVSDRNDLQLRSHVETYDLELRHHVSSNRHDLVWGLEGRLIHDRLDSTAVLFFDPASELRHQVGGFAQDELALADRRVRVTVGVRVDRTPSRSLEWQPTGRLLWSPDPHHTLWGAVSRAVRTPSRAENDVRYHIEALSTGGPPAVVTLYGNPGFRSEVLVAYEAGYRFIPAPAAMVDVTAFYNEYQHLRTLEPATSTFVPSAPPYVDVRQLWANRMHGDARGLEGSAEWNVSSSWKLNVSASCLGMRLHLDPDGQDLSSQSSQDNEPRYQLVFQSQLHPARRWRWDATVYQVGNRPNEHIPAYTRLDLGLGRRWSDGIDLSLVGANLLQRRHFEDDGVMSGVIPTEVERSLLARLSVHL